MNKIIEAEREGASRAICDALARTHGRSVDAAKLLGTTRQNLNAKMKRLGIQAADWRIT